MAFLIPILILKCLGLGPRALLTPDELAKFNQDVGKAETMGLQEELDAALQVLARVHSVLALLQAAMNPPDDTAAAKPGVTGNIVAAYADDESKEFENATKAIKGDGQAIDPNLGKRLEEAVLQKFDLSQTGQEGTPVLELFLKGFRANGSAANLNPSGCLKVCRHSVSDAQGVNPQAPLYMAKASGLLTLLWGPNVERDLTEVRDWLAQIMDPATGEWHTEAWLNGQLEVAWLTTARQQIYHSADQQAMLALSRIAVLLNTSRDKIFPQVYGRMADTVNGMEKTIEDFNHRTGATAAQREAWRNLLAATYGAIAWQILRKARLAVAEAHLVFDKE